MNSDKVLIQENTIEFKSQPLYITDWMDVTSVLQEICDHHDRIIIKLDESVFALTSMFMQLMHNCAIHRDKYFIIYGYRDMIDFLREMFCSGTYEVRLCNHFTFSVKNSY